ncbi:MAG TPA: pyridoxal-phosphate dependent enzyme [Gammaproteobacteria bacterium]|nr:pyridoxal-phosphate dependent enzyme [Gammaproteobacteria bacterium]
MAIPTLQLPSPITQIFSPLLDARQLQLFIKRDDLIHPVISGNKWRKLKYNLQQAKKEQQSCLLTFGGAWSNHIHATAAAGNYFGFKTIGIIRGESPPTLSATLQDAQDWGMQLHFVNREQYRHKTEADFMAGLRQQFGNFYLLPEGGSNTLAMQGCAEIIDELTEPYDVLCVDCGTGTTLAGVICGNKDQTQVLGFSVLKGGDFLSPQVQSMLDKAHCHYHNWQINKDYHFGGYAKTTPALFEFMETFKLDHGVQLEPVYSGKMFYGIFDLIKKGYFKQGSRILALHGGGLQGLRGYNLD